MSLTKLSLAGNDLVINYVILGMRSEALFIVHDWGGKVGLWHRVAVPAIQGT
jgi:hypothetical protein